MLMTIQANQFALEMALARIRQLSAHEVGHTIGLAHNFAASTKGRSSVMDYPHPTLSIKDGKVDFTDAYDTKIGDWDKVSIAYSYGEYLEDEDASLSKLLDEAFKKRCSFYFRSRCKTPRKCSCLCSFMG